MADQGFRSAQQAGDVSSRPRLLSRQTVVVGISDGVIRPSATALVPRVRLQTTLPPPTQQLLASFRWVAEPIPASAMRCAGSVRFVFRGQVALTLPVWN